MGFATKYLTHFQGSQVRIPRKLNSEQLEIETFNQARTDLGQAIVPLAKWLPVHGSLD